MNKFEKPKRDGTSNQRKEGKGSERNFAKKSFAKKSFSRDRKPVGRRLPGANGRLDQKRLLAIDVINEVWSDGAYAHIALPNRLAKSKLDVRDRAFATQLVYSALRLWGRHEIIVTFLSERKLTKIEPKVQAILHCAITEIITMRSKDRAVVYEYVEIAKKISGISGSTFVNAILRTLTRSIEEGQDPIKEIEGTLANKPIELLSFQTAHPVWILESYYQKLKSWDEVAALAKANNEAPRIDVIAFPSRTSGKLSDYPTLHPIRYSTWGASAPAEFLNGNEIATQKFGVQNEGSQIVSLLWVATSDEQFRLSKEHVSSLKTNPSDKLTWLDLCAGPGGKAAFTATWLEKFRPNDHFIANEINPTRAQLIRNRLPKSRILELDGSKSAGFTEKYDRILIDAPCTGLGSIGRRPESRWRKKSSDISALVTIQRDLIANAIAMLKPGGILGYVTCSPHLLETKGQMVEMKHKHPEMEEVSMLEVIGAAQLTQKEDLLTAREGENALQLWTHRNQTDSMYLSLWRKKNIEGE